MYDATPNPDDEKEGKDSLYGPLLGDGSAAAPASYTPSGPARHAPASSSHFVNFDRYLNANKETVDKQRGGLQSSADSRYAALTDGINKSQPTANNPPPVQAGTTITPITARDTQAAGIGQLRQELHSAPEVSKDEATTYAGATYSGPTQATVDSQFNPLLGTKNALVSEAGAAKQGHYTGNTFNDALIRGEGGVDYSKEAGLDKTYTDAYTKASDGAKNSQKDFETNRSDWQKLLEANAPLEEQQRQTAQTAQDNADTAAARASRIDSFASKLTGGAGEPFKNASPEAQDEIMKLDPSDSMGSLKVIKILYQDDNRQYATSTLEHLMKMPTVGNLIAKWTPEEIAHFKSLNLRSLDGAAEARRMISTPRRY